MKPVCGWRWRRGEYSGRDTAGRTRVRRRVVSSRRSNLCGRADATRERTTWDTRAARVLRSGAVGRARKQTSGQRRTCRETRAVTPQWAERSVNPEKAEELSPELQRALEPLLACIESVSERIREYNERIEAMAEQSYPQVALLKQIKGVGTLIALTFLLTLEDPHRFPKSRDVGGFLGLQPGRRKSGQSEPQTAYQQGRRSVSAHAAGAGSAAHPGTVRGGLRSPALGTEAGGAWWEEREEAGDRCHREKAGGVAASLVGERRSVRTVA